MRRIEGEPSLEGLLARQARFETAFETAIEKVRSTRGNLGTADGVEHLNRFDPAISLGEKLRRTEKVGRIRLAIDRKTLPTLEGHLQEVKGKVLAHPDYDVHARIQAIRELFNEGGLTKEELEQAKQDAARILGKKTEQPRPEIVKVPTKDSEQRGGGSQRLFAIALPDGQTIKTNGRVKADVLRALASAPDFTMPIEELTRAIYGEDNIATRSRLYAVIERLRRELEKPFGYHIEQPVTPAERFLGKTARYTLKKEMEPSLPKITINLDTHQVEIQGRKVIIQRLVQWAILLHLAQNAGSEISWQEIEKVAKEAGSHVKHSPGGAAICSLRLNLGDHDRKILTRRGPKNQAKYVLNTQVKFVSEVTQTPATQPKEEKPRFPFIPVWPSRIAALNAICDNPDMTIEEIIEILGLSTNTGKPLNRGSALGALRINTSRLALRILRFGEIAEPQEKALWAKISNSVGIEGGPGIIKAFNDKLREWYAKQRALTKEDLHILKEAEVAEEIKPVKLSKLQAAALGTLLVSQHNQRFNLDSEGSFVFEVDEEFKGLVKKLVENLPRPLTVSDIDIEGRIALAVVDKILKSENADEIFKLQTNTDIYLLLLWIFYKNSEQMREILKHLQRETPEEPIVFPAPVAAEAPVATEDVNALAAKPKPIVVFVPPPTIPRVPRIEQRDPQVRPKINDYLNKIEAKGITNPLHSAQLVRAFPHLTATFVNWIELEKRYISPERAQDGRHPVFNTDEIALMLYVYDQKNTLNLGRARIKELKRIIVEEIQKREQAKIQVQNGVNRRATASPK